MKTQQSTATLSLLALGIVYGDIGTSPLYAVKETFNPEHGIPLDTGNIIGGLSTIAGPIVGAVVIFGLQQLLLDFQTLSTLIIGVLLIAIVRTAPNGLTGLLRKGDGAA